MLAKLNPLNSFFGKIFLWFWLTLSAIIIIAIFFFSRWKEPYQLVEPNSSQRQQAVDIAQAVAAINAPDRHQFQRALHDLGRQHNVELYPFKPGLKPFKHRRFPRWLYPMIVAINSSDELIVGLWHHESWLGPIIAKHKGRPINLFLRGANPQQSWWKRWISSPPMQLLIALPLTLLFSYWLAWSLSKPLKRLENAAKDIGQGELSRRLSERDCSRRDEIGNLARQFNSMSAALETMLNTQKRLLGNISHELRSPLTRLQVALAIAEKGAPEHLQPMLERIGLEGERLEQMIHQVLLLAKLETTTDSWPMVPVELLNLVKGIISDCQFEANSLHKEVTFHPTLEPTTDECWTIGNEQLLRSAIENIIRNGLHHTPANTRVDVAFSYTQDQWLICICDHGKGVREDKIPYLFDAFFRVDQTSDNTGMGLGLSIAKQAITLHNGSLSARNAETGGLCIGIYLPTQQPPVE